MIFFSALDIVLKSSNKSPITVKQRATSTYSVPNDLMSQLDNLVKIFLISMSIFLKI